MDVSDTDEWLYLLGWPPIQDFLRFIHQRAIDAAHRSEKGLADAWARARVRTAELVAASREAHAKSPIEPLPADIEALAERALRDETLQRTFGSASCRWAWVALDDLIVTQKAVNLRAVADITRTLPPSPAHVDLMALALGQAAHASRVWVSQPSEGTWCFTSASEGLRFLDIDRATLPLLAQYRGAGHVREVVGVLVGFGVNVLSALEVDARVLLVNGTHRAFALRSLGVTHAPCLLVKADTPEELARFAPLEVRHHSGTYLRARRPPRLGDFFDSLLTYRLRAERTQWLLELQIMTKRTQIPSAHRMDRLSEGTIFSKSPVSDTPDPPYGS